MKGVVLLIIIQKVFIIYQLIYNIKLSTQYKL